MQQLGPNQQRNAGQRVEGHLGMGLPAETSGCRQNQTGRQHQMGQLAKGAGQTEHFLFFKF